MLNMGMKKPKATSEVTRLAFSASSSRNRVRSETLAPPYLLRHLKKGARLMP